MHDSAYQIGCLAMDLYTDLHKATILEIGSYSVNGSLRDHALPATQYIGLDIAEGPGVDIVIEEGAAFPVEDESYDLVIASSVLEHDPAFWTTFLEMCRKAKQGGYIYINVPSNGAVHRYPTDNWRFYPDSSRALVKWCVSQGVEISLVESFLAVRKKDIWNDFVAVFRKGHSDKSLPTNLLHEQIPCNNVLIGNLGDIINNQHETEDMLIITEVQNALAEAHRVEEGLQQRLSAYQSEIFQLGQRYNELEQQLDAVQQRALEAQKLIDLYEKQLNTANAEIVTITDEKLRADAVRQQVESSLHNHISINTELSKQLVHSEAGIIHYAHLTAWLQNLIANNEAVPRWWSLMPQSWREKRKWERLNKQVLFDSKKYLSLNPDVGVDGMDPLRHYILHGITEGRRT
jgi:hypothetical protein